MKRRSCLRAMPLMLRSLRLGSISLPNSTNRSGRKSTKFSRLMVVTRWFHPTLCMDGAVSSRLVWAASRERGGTLSREMSLRDSVCITVRPPSRLRYSW